MDVIAYLGRAVGASVAQAGARLGPVPRPSVIAQLAKQAALRKHAEWEDWAGTAAGVGIPLAAGAALTALTRGRFRGRAPGLPRSLSRGPIPMGVGYRPTAMPPGGAPTGTPTGMPTGVGGGGGGGLGGGGPGGGGGGGGGGPNWLGRRWGNVRNNPRSTALGAVGTVGAGGVGLQHANNQARYDAESHWYNPLSWNWGGQSQEQRENRAYGANRDEANRLTQPLQHRLANTTDPDEHGRLLQQISQTQVDRPWGALGGLNPFASRGGQYHQSRMTNIGNRVQQQYNEASGGGPGSNMQRNAEQLTRLNQMLQQGNLSEQQHNLIAGQITRLQNQQSTGTGGGGEDSPQARAAWARAQQMGLRLARRPQPSFGADFSNFYTGRPGGPVPYDPARHGRGLDWGIMGHAIGNSPFGHNVN